MFNTIKLYTIALVFIGTMIVGIAMGALSAYSLIRGDINLFSAAFVALGIGCAWRLAEMVRVELF